MFKASGNGIQFESPEIKKVTLIVQQMAQSMIIEDRILSCANTDVLIQSMHQFMRGYQVYVRSMMAGEKIQTHKYPTTWWDAFKTRWFPKFLITKYPSNYTTVETWHCYPEYPLPDQKAIQYLVVR